MLILSRKPNESLVILDSDGKTARVIISVLAVEGDKVKLGISAPREVGILRQELWQSMQIEAKIFPDTAVSPEPSGLDAPGTNGRPAENGKADNT
jgi:carbon storage regulator